MYYERVMITHGGTSGLNQVTTSIEKKGILAS